MSLDRREILWPWFVVPEMKGVFQRILQATLLKDGVSVKQVGRGFVLFIAFHKDDTVKDLEMISNKVINARLWDEGTHSWNKSVKDLGYEVIVVYQPDLLRNIFDHSSSELMPDEKAADLYGKFVQQLKDGLKNSDKVISAEYTSAKKFSVHLVNDGPVTIMLDTRKDKE